MTREIPLTRGYVALVDDEDYEAVMAAGPWRSDAGGNDDLVYAARGIPRPGAVGKALRSTQRLHSFLTGWGLVDHANGDGLDNRRANLRPAAHATNQYNSRRRSDNTSGYKGVSRHKHSGWQALIRVDGRRVHLGVFKDPVEAALAYDAAAREVAGEFACVNFPREGERGAA